jgi:hypothetical protein
VKSSTESVPQMRRSTPVRSTTTRMWKSSTSTSIKRKFRLSLRKQTMTPRQCPPCLLTTWEELDHLDAGREELDLLDAGWVGPVRESILELVTLLVSVQYRYTHSSYL